MEYINISFVSSPLFTRIRIPLLLFTDPFRLSSNVMNSISCSAIANLFSSPSAADPSYTPRPSKYSLPAPAVHPLRPVSLTHLGLLVHLFAGDPKGIAKGSQNHWCLGVYRRNKYRYVKHFQSVGSWMSKVSLVEANQLIYWKPRDVHRDH